MRNIFNTTIMSVLVHAHVNVGFQTGHFWVQVCILDPSMMQWYVSVVDQGVHQEPCSWCPRHNTDGIYSCKDNSSAGSTIPKMDHIFISYI